MKEIKLTQGKVALVDDEDYDFLMQWKWFATKAKLTYYADRCLWINKSCRHLSMHRFIMNAPIGKEIDHINHNGLDNQKSNLRICDKAENNRNRTAIGKSKYLGVYFEYHGGILYIRASIRTGNKRIFLGSFKTEEEAALAYDKAAIIYHGNFANTNFKS